MRPKIDTARICDLIVLGALNSKLTRLAALCSSLFI